MLSFLVHMHSVLISSPVLTGLIPPENIGAVVRQPSATLVLEYGISNEQADHAGHRDLSIQFTVYSQTGGSDVYAIKDAVEQLMTALNLTPSGGGFRTSQVRLSDSKLVSRNEWASALRFGFDIRIADASARTQKQ